MVVGLLNPISVEDSQFWIVPVCPLKTKKVLFVPVQTVPEPDKVPPTLAASTVTVAIAELAISHTPLLTTAL